MGMMKADEIILFGYGSDLGAGRGDAGQGAEAVQAYLQQHPTLKQLNWSGIVSQRDIDMTATSPHHFAEITQLCERLANYTYQAINQQQFPIVIGGDHSCAIGTWSGIASALRKRQETLGLIWIDAHLDSHTHITTPSHNAHGMPAASLLGDGPELFTHIKGAFPKLLPEHICFIGIRDFESKEEIYMKKNGIRVYDIKEVKQRGLDIVLSEAVNNMRDKADFYGITIDIDAFDPSEAPGVNTPVKNGITTANFLPCLNSIRNDAKFIGLEIAEYNPNFDKGQKTPQLIAAILEQIIQRP